MGLERQASHHGQGEGDPASRSLVFVLGAALEEPSDLRGLLDREGDGLYG